MTGPDRNRVAEAGLVILIAATWLMPQGFAPLQLGFPTSAREVASPSTRGHPGLAISRQKVPATATAS